MKVKRNVLAGSVAGLLGLASWQASALEPDAALSNVPDRGINIVAGILDGTLDFGEAILFASGGLYGDEGLFEDYLRDFLLGPTGKEGILAEHGFGGALIGGYGVAANALAPHGYLVSTALWAVGGDPHEVTSNHAPGPLSPSGGPLELPLHGPAHAAHHQDSHSGLTALAPANFSSTSAQMLAPDGGSGGLLPASAGIPGGALGTGPLAGSGVLGGLGLK